MSVKIEQVARAIELAEEEWLRREGDAQDGLQEHNTVPLRVAVARAAIEAMREPTEAMTLEGFGALEDDLLEGGEGHEPIQAAWRAMIDEALKC